MRPRLKRLKSEWNEFEVTCKRCGLIFMCRYSAYHNSFGNLQLIPGEKFNVASISWRDEDVMVLSRLLLFAVCQLETTKLVSARACVYMRVCV